MHRQAKFSMWKKYKKPRDGQTFAKSCRCLSDHYHRSGLEGRVCDELRLRKLAGDIADWRREVPITLMEGDVNVSKFIGKYYADFVVDHNDGTQEIIEAKGIQFTMFKKKWAALEKMYKDDPKMKLTIVTR